jgi:hypothetical protein
MWVLASRPVIMLATVLMRTTFAKVKARLQSQFHVDVGAFHPEGTRSIKGFGGSSATGGRGAHAEWVGSIRLQDRNARRLDFAEKTLVCTPAGTQRRIESGPCFVFLVQLSQPCVCLEQFSHQQRRHAGRGGHGRYVKSKCR